MQANVLPIQISGAGATPARPANGSHHGGGEGAQFSQALSREMAQRQNAAAAPAPAPNRAAAKPASPDRPPQPAAQRAAEKAPEKVADQPGKDGTAEAADPTASQSRATDAGAPQEASQGSVKPDEAAESSAGEAAAAVQDALGPMAEMLALVAGFNPPAVAQAASAPLAAAGTAGVNGIAVDAGSAGTRAVDIDAAALPAGAAGFSHALGTAQAGAAQAGAAAADALQDAASGFVLPPELAQARGHAQADSAAIQRRAALPSDTQAMATVQDQPGTPVSDAAPSTQALGDPADIANSARSAPSAGVAGADPRGAVAIQQPQLAPADAARHTEFRAPDAVQANVELQVQAASSQPLSGPVQQLTAALAQTMSSAAADHIPARVGTTAWENQVGQKIVWMVAGEEQSATLTLNPPDLGPMQVVLSVTNDQASVAFTSAQPEVRQALEDAMPKLREMMSESGLSLGNASVDAGSPQQQAFAGAEGGDGNTRPGARGQGGRSDNLEATPAANGRAPRPGGGNGLVDTFA